MKDLNAFYDELEQITKEAALPTNLGQLGKSLKSSFSGARNLMGRFHGGLTGDLGEAAQRYLHPIKGTLKGWRYTTRLYFFPEFVLC